MLKVNLDYFKESGKWYAEGSFESNRTELYEIFADVQNMLDKNILPGLAPGHSCFYVIIDVPDHKNNHPHMCIPEELRR